MTRRATWTGCLAICALWAVGCGDDGGGSPFDPNSWSGMNAALIEHDCMHTVQCMSQRGELPPVDDPIGNCLHTTATLLDNDANKRTEFVSNNSRCASFVVCQYVDCAITDATSTYGETQFPLISQDCTAKLECESARGNPPADFQNALDTCIATNINVLNNYTAQDRFNYETQFANCQTLASCDFVTCLWGG